MEPELLTKVKNYAVENKILHKNDSQLIRNVLSTGIVDVSDNKLTIYIMKEQLEKNKKETEALISQVEQIGGINAELLKQNTILQNNLDKKLYGIKTKKIQKRKMKKK